MYRPRVSGAELGLATHGCISGYTIAGVTMYVIICLPILGDWVRTQSDPCRHTRVGLMAVYKSFVNTTIILL
jgi:hypothetical protein